MKNESMEDIPENENLEFENNTTENSSENNQEENEFDEELGAIDQLGKDLDNAYRRNGEKITEEEARIIDELCKEYGKSRHHDIDCYYEHPHRQGPHTHIGHRHIYFE